MTTDNTNTRNDSLAARTDTWLQSLLVWSPGQRDIIKTVALVLMVLDHINLIFQLKQEWMFLAGRGAFPLFALVWGLNLSRHTHIRQVTINRLWGWAVIAQFAYYLAGFPWYEGNILFAFAVAAQVLTVGLVSCAGKSLPRFWPGDFFPTFYACHLAVLGVLAL
ncbi:type-F conjugative transfer system pilin acetylase TraX [Escherichia coli]|nr:type-F conjugative transfer system pilin acetylase TraX [Escherichia coli]HDJ0137408.1 type-F conjugative transfer system pilin acetylase TraX [Escherichia coli]